MITLYQNALQLQWLAMDDFMVYFTTTFMHLNIYLQYIWVGVNLTPFHV